MANVLNGTAVVFAFTTTAGITITGLSGVLLQSKDHSLESDNDTTRDGTGNVVQTTDYNFRDVASLRYRVSGTSLSDAKVNTALKTPGTILVVTACADDPAMVKTNWIVQSGAKIMQTNTSAAEIELPLIAYPGVTAVSS